MAQSIHTFMPKGLVFFPFSDQPPVTLLPTKGVLFCCCARARARVCVCARARVCVCVCVCVCVFCSISFTEREGGDRGEREGERERDSHSIKLDSSYVPASVPSIPPGREIHLFSLALTFLSF